MSHNFISHHEAPFVQTMGLWFGNSADKNVIWHRQVILDRVLEWQEVWEPWTRSKGIFPFQWKSSFCTYYLLCQVTQGRYDRLSSVGNFLVLWCNFGSFRMYLALSSLYFGFCNFTKFDTFHVISWRFWAFSTFSVSVPSLFSQIIGSEIQN